MGQGKLVLVLVQLTFMKQLYNSEYSCAKITIHDFENYPRVYFAQFHLSETWILEKFSS